MNTEILKIDPLKINMEKIKYAASVLKQGGVVVFPTETVYGLGAYTFDENAVEKIFKAKGRPQDNPLIVHVGNKQEIALLTKEVTLKDRELINAFWPGPLTLILKKSELVKDIVTAGLDTVAVRMPSHNVALSLIEECSFPIAAPSANISGKPSPTSFEHVFEDLNGRVDLIIDSGESNIGLESTILDVTGEKPMILRPGGITIENIKRIVNNVEMHPSILKEERQINKPKSPGMKYKHYSPGAELIIVEGEMVKVSEKINELFKEYQNKKVRTGILATEQTYKFYDCKDLIIVGDRENPETIASNLYKAFRDFDKRGVEVILAESIGYNDMRLAITNRMMKASDHNIVKV